MTVKPATVFGKGIEVICRFKAVGSFIRRYGLYIESGADLPGYVEITLKDDERQDPLITKEGLITLNIINEEQYNKIVELTETICNEIKNELAKKDLELYDIKLEFGELENGQIALIDELSGGNMRVYKKDEYIEPMEIGEYLF